MSETIGTDGTVREAYAFVCISCGRGWEQAYEIEHHVDAQGRELVWYMVEGKRVPSPLTRPTCVECEGHKVRIMRAGQVSDVTGTWSSTATAGPLPCAAPRRPVAAVAPVEGGAERRGRHWSPLHLLHRRRDQA
ncbi:hypothetical protein ABZ883_27830 [Streptomyces sp. NPDC046977]|uniref:hypothetical protein n=1 Tax=Streptomyces sp. NPDC046977 TaxID=3154703 RepID=UPI0033CC152B